MFDAVGVLAVAPGTGVESLVDLNIVVERHSPLLAFDCMKKMLYKQNLKETITRLKDFWSGNAGDRILVQFMLHNQYLDEYLSSQRLPANEIVYREGDPEGKFPSPETKFGYVDNQLRIRAGLDDDSVPVAYMHLFDQGIYGGLFGGRAIFNLQGRGSSMSEPVLDDWDSFSQLAFDKDHFWIRKFREHLEYYKERGKGKFGVGTLISIDTLNFVVELRGATKAYLDLYDSPDKVREAMEFALSVNIGVCRMQRDAVGLYENGSFMHPRYGGWFPEDTCFLSVDAYSLCAPGTYSKMGLEYQQRFINSIGKGFMHTHGMGRHLLPEIVQLDGLVGIQLGDDGASERAIDSIDRIKKITGDIPLIVECEKQDLLAGMEDGSLPGGVMYTVVSGVETVDEANAIMKRVKEYRYK